MPECQPTHQELGPFGPSLLWIFVVGGIVQPLCLLVEEFIDFLDQGQKFFGVLFDCGQPCQLHPTFGVLTHYASLPLRSILRYESWQPVPDLRELSVHAEATTQGRELAEHDSGHRSLRQMLTHLQGSNARLDEDQGCRAEHAGAVRSAHLQAHT
jgi:hypothetical protein